MLDVKRLRVLREVAARGSFSAAAEALAYTQSAVSQQIAALEREAGTRLVDRSARGVRLTEAGRALVRLAALDSAAVPFGQVLIAEVDGQPKAALSLADGGVVADPFSRTAELVGLLRMHAGAVAERETSDVARPAFGRSLRLAA